MIATSGAVRLKALSSPIEYVAAVVAVVSYVGMGFIGARFDEAMSKQCDIWRKMIFRVSSDGYNLQDQDAQDLLFFERPRAVVFYLGSFALVTVITICLVILLSGTLEAC